MAENPGLSNSQSNHPFDYGYEHPIYPGNYNMVNSSELSPTPFGSEGQMLRLRRNGAIQLWSAR